MDCACVDMCMICSVCVYTCLHTCHVMWHGHCDVYRCVPSCTCVLCVLHHCMFVCTIYMPVHVCRRACMHVGVHACGVYAHVCARVPGTVRSPAQLHQPELLVPALRDCHV